MQNDPEALEDKKTEQTPAAAPAPTPIAAASTAASVPAAAATAAAGSASQAVSGMDFGSLSLVTAFFALIVMIQSAVVCGNGPINTCSQSLQAYQVAVGTVSAFFGLLGFAMNLKTKVADNVALILGLFQFLWWIAGVIVLTFFADYQTTLYANGYFGSWGAFIFATFTMMSVSEVFKQNVSGFANSSRKALLFLFCASSVVMGASIAPCSPSNMCTGYNAFAVALGVISMFISLVLIFASGKMTTGHMRNVALFLILWWGIGTAVVTFGGPFKSTGNGYFASYVALISSVGVLQSVNAEA